MNMGIIGIVITALILIILFANIRIVPQANEDVVELLGK